MTAIYVDATTLIALGAIGELDLLLSFDGTLVVLPVVREEITTEPARTNCDRLCDRPTVETTMQTPAADDKRAQAILEESTVNGDVRVIAAVVAHTAADEPVAVVSDDRRVRTVARGLGATVTGTIGVIVRAVEEGLSEADAKAIVRRVDDHGLHMTADLRDTAVDLIETAARSR
ncbi:hypothetical protein G9464_03045 [Halostella sp. JP-L12]|uniref:hypothetical protein n=1 Tax=Halostella TaxID=1843185 RepID=UPI000EF7A4D3|nr:MULTISPECIES: hypothetical protein [Halostella]NHN46575.1 hypothetical protein [Halostella sp. JP-L12]